MRKGPVKPFYDLCRFLLKIVAIVFFGLKVEGAENLPREGGVLLVSNHASYLDPPVIAVAAKRRLNFMARHTLFRPVFGLIISALGAFPIKRGAMDRGALKETLDRIAQGETVLLFPEGTRTRDGKVQQGKPGAGMIARMAKGVVIPAYVEGTYTAWPKGGRFRRHPFRVVFGPAVEMTELKRLKDKNASGLAADQLVQAIRALSEKRGSEENG